MESPSNKRRTSSSRSSVAGDSANGQSQYPNSPGSPATEADKREWGGFCELRSDPLIFNTLLRECGTKGLKVEDVCSLDDMSLGDLSQPIYAFIFLFQYEAESVIGEEKHCPDNVWFANQTFSNACGTFALLNIINNIPEAHLGEHLQSFRDFTAKFTPYARGNAVNDFQFLKRKHNSFARKMDMLIADEAMQKEFEKRPKTSKQAARKAPAKRNGTKRKAAQMDKVDANTPYHFDAYIPINGEIWKLDGLDASPENLGSASSEGWVTEVRTILQERMAQCVDRNYNIMAVVGDGLLERQRLLAMNVKDIAAIQARLWFLWDSPLTEEGQAKASELKATGDAPEGASSNRAVANYASQAKDTDARTGEKINAEDNPGEPEDTASDGGKMAPDDHRNKSVEDEEDKTADDPQGSTAEDDAGMDNDFQPRYGVAPSVMLGPDEALGITKYLWDGVAVSNDTQQVLDDGTMEAMRTLQYELAEKQTQLIADVHWMLDQHLNDGENVEVLRSDHSVVMKTWVEMLAQKPGIMEQLLKETQ
ncbi:MAG: hypothetical protein M1831_006793 [Alyxoria varia]|nr:MAG: hypothetical protein M1831_006793 [Alyxoria varia]